MLINRECLVLGHPVTPPIPSGAQDLLRNKAQDKSYIR